jgi:hypothetical protein
MYVTVPLISEAAMVLTANEARHEMQQVPAVLRQQSIIPQNRGEGAIGHLI